MARDPQKKSRNSLPLPAATSTKLVLTLHKLPSKPAEITRNRKLFTESSLKSQPMRATPLKMTTLLTITTELQAIEVMMT